MRRWRDGQVWRLPVSGRAFIHRFGFAILLTIAFTLMVMGQAENAIAERLRTAVTDALAPVLGALSRPVESVQGMIREVGHLFALRDENARLRGDNERLRRWETVARRLETENAALRGLLNFKPDPTGAFVSARVVGDSGSAFIRAMSTTERECIMTDPDGSQTKRESFSGNVSISPSGSGVPSPLSWRWRDIQPYIRSR